MDFVDKKSVSGNIVGFFYCIEYRPTLLFSIIFNLIWCFCIKHYFNLNKPTLVYLFYNISFKQTKYIILISAVVTFLPHNKFEVYPLFLLYEWVYKRSLAEFIYSRLPFPGTFGTWAMSNNWIFRIIGLYFSVIAKRTLVAPWVGFQSQFQVTDRYLYQCHSQKHESYLLQ